jgi:hypothetical protein
MKAEIKAVLDRLLDFKPKVRREPDPRQGLLLGVLVETAPVAAPEAQGYATSTAEVSEQPKRRRRVLVDKI